MSGQPVNKISAPRIKTMPRECSTCHAAMTYKHYSECIKCRIALYDELIAHSGERPMTNKADKLHHKEMIEDRDKLVALLAKRAAEAAAAPVIAPVAAPAPPTAPVAEAAIADDVKAHKAAVKAAIDGLGAGYEHWTIQRRSPKDGVPYYVVTVCRFGERPAGALNRARIPLTEDEQTRVQNSYKAHGFAPVLRILHP
jgi:hypothetical protein